MIQYQHQPTVVIDLDGVLFDFEKAFCRKFGYAWRNLVNLEWRYPHCISEIHEFINDPRTYKDLEVLDLGRRIVEFLSPDYLISIVSSRPQESFTYTVNALKDNNIPYFSLSVGNGKIKRIMKLNPIFVIDDMDSVKTDCRVVGVPCILIKQPWNSGKITTFEKFLEELEKVL